MIILLLPQTKMLKDKPISLMAGTESMLPDAIDPYIIMVCAAAEEDFDVQPWYVHRYMHSIHETDSPSTPPHHHHHHHHVTLSPTYLPTSGPEEASKHGHGRKGGKAPAPSYRDPRHEDGGAEEELEG